MKTHNIRIEPADKEIGTYKCELCGEIGKLILRSGVQFRAWRVECPNGHRPQIKKEIDDIFQIGDRIRIYHSPFGKNQPIDFTTYDEGIITEKEINIINYRLSMKIEKAVVKNKHLPKHSWRYGTIIRDICSDDSTIELLTKQMRLIV